MLRLVVYLRELWKEELPTQYHKGFCQHLPWAHIMQQIGTAHISAMGQPHLGPVESPSAVRKLLFAQVPKQESSLCLILWNQSKNLQQFLRHLSLSYPLSLYSNLSHLPLVLLQLCSGIQAFFLCIHPSTLYLFSLSTSRVIVLKCIVLMPSLPTKPFTVLKCSQGKV